MASGEVPGKSHHFGITWFEVVANVPSNIFFVKGGARKSLCPGPSQALTGGWTLSVMRALPSSLHIFNLSCCFCLHAGISERMALTRNQEHLNSNRYYMEAQ